MQAPVTQLYENTWAIEDRGVRIFVLEGTERAMVVDTGMTGLDIRTLAGGLTHLPLFLVNTHADMDHVAGNGVFDSFYMHPAEAAVYHHGPICTGKIIPVYEGTVFDLGNRPVKVLHIPGHTPGSISLLDVGHRSLIGGDPIQEDGGIYMFGPYRDMEAYVLGLEHVWEFEAEYDSIYPSHAKMPVNKNIIPKLIEGAKAILAGTVEGVPGEMHGYPILTYDIGVCQLFCDRQIFCGEK